jgi:hypothetical protein
MSETSIPKTPKCFEKIATDSPLYLRRLAREINSRAFQGIYVCQIDKNGRRQSERVIAARYSSKAGRLQICTLGADRDNRDKWTAVAFDECYDGLGNQVWASTTRCGR